MQIMLEVNEKMKGLSRDIWRQKIYIYIMLMEMLGFEGRRKEEINK